MCAKRVNFHFSVCAKHVKFLWITRKFISNIDSFRIPTCSNENLVFRPNFKAENGWTLIFLSYHCDQGAKLMIYKFSLDCRSVLLSEGIVSSGSKPFWLSAGLSIHALLKGVFGNKC